MEGGKPVPGAATSEGVLASFFNSLLSKQTGHRSPGQPGASPNRGEGEDCKKKQTKG